MQDLVPDPLERVPRDVRLEVRVGHGLLVDVGEAGHGLLADFELLVERPLADEAEQLLGAGDDGDVLLGGGHDSHHNLVANTLLGVVLSLLQRVADVLLQLRMVQEEVHCVLDALGPDGDRDVVVSAEEGQPELPVIPGQV